MKLVGDARLMAMLPDKGGFADTTARPGSDSIAGRDTDAALVLVDVKRI